MPEVVTYRDEYRTAFEQLNREWIETWFSLEEADRETFRDPGAKSSRRAGRSSSWWTAAIHWPRVP